MPEEIQIEEGLVNQLSAIRNALDRAHEIQLEINYNKVLRCTSLLALPFCLLFAVCPKLTDHLQIMAVQQQNQAIAEDKLSREQEIKLKAQIASASVGMIAPPPSTFVVFVLISLSLCL